MNVVIGGLDATTDWVDRLPLPVLPQISAVGWTSDALMRASSERKGIVLVGEQGSGKTIGLQRAISRFNEAESLKAKQEDGYIPKGLVYLPTIRGRTGRDVLIAIWSEGVGFEPVLNRGNSSVTDHALTKEPVTHLTNQNVAVLVIDEAENLPIAGLEAVRDLMAVSESTAPTRFTDDGYVPAGIGVVLAGNTKLEFKIRRYRELGQRLVTLRHVAVLEAAEVPRIYRQMVPGFERHAEKIGDEAWARLIYQLVTDGCPVPIRYVENHIRAYARRAATKFQRDAKGLDDLEFHEQAFTWTLREVERPRLDSHEDAEDSRRLTSA